MPKLDSFTLEIKTGAKAGPEIPSFAINGFPLEFDSAEGNTQPGETIVLTGSPNSYPHSLVVIGPQNGQPAWDIESITATYDCSLMEPYTIRMGAVTLDDESNLNFWNEPPLPVFDV